MMYIEQCSYFPFSSTNFCNAGSVEYNYPKSTEIYVFLEIAKMVDPLAQHSYIAYINQ